jgi:hypothetical protein
VIQPDRPVLTWLAWADADRAREAAYHLPCASWLVHDESWQAHVMPESVFLAICLIRIIHSTFAIHAFTVSVPILRHAYILSAGTNPPSHLMIVIPSLHPV